MRSRPECPSRDQPHAARRRLWGVVVLGAVCLAGVPSPLAAALEPGPASPADGLYGRFDGDLVLSVGVSGGPVFDRGFRGGLVELDLRARYLDAAGLVVAPAWFHDPAFPLREAIDDGAGRLFVGLEVRPFFPARFLLDLWTGSRWTDLLIDSIGVELGVVVGPFGAPGTSDGVAFAWGAGVELPLLTSDQLAHGLRLRLAVRRVTSRSGDQAGPEGERHSDWTLLTGLVFRGLADLGTQRR